MPQWLMSHRWLLLGVLCAGLLFALAACGDDEGDGGEESPAATSPAEESPDAGGAPCEGGPGVEGSGEPLKIGVLVPFTGALSSFGPEYENAANLAAKCINNAGGVNGGEVEIITGDDQTAAQGAVAEATRLVDVEGVAAIVGGAASSVSLAVAESVSAPNQILQISPASTSPSLTAANDEDFLFRTPISDAAQGVVLAQLVSEDLGFTSVCAMYVNNPYGQGLVNQFEESFTDAGGTLTAKVPHDDAQAVSYQGQLQECTTGDPEALVAISYPVGQGTVYLREAIEGGLVDQFVFVDGTKDDEMFAELGWDQFDGMRGTAASALKLEFGEEFDDNYEAEYGDRYQVPFVREAFDAVVVIALAASAAGTNTESVAIRDALRDVSNAPGTEYGPGIIESPTDLAAALEAAAGGEDIDYSGASGSVDFDDNGDVLFGAIEVWSIDAANEELVTEEIFSVDLETGTVESIGAPEEEPDEDGGGASPTGSP
jgi:ABC-type branched-subunit amino acid transport system substrate-binding protein